MSKIISLADAYAAEQQDWGSGSERTRVARAALVAEVEKLEAELEAARKDVARYRQALLQSFVQVWRQPNEHL